MPLLQWVLGIMVVLTLLAAVLFPLMGGRSAQPKWITCLSGLKQIGLSSISYSLDNDDRLPRSTDWMDVLLPYFKHEELLHDREGVPPGQYGYAFRASDSSAKFSEIQNPAKHILLFDSNLTGRNASSELWSTPQPGRHSGRDNLVFGDSHAKNYSSKADEKDSTEMSPLQRALVDDDRSMKPNRSYIFSRGGRSSRIEALPSSKRG